MYLKLFCLVFSSLFFQHYALSQGLPQQIKTSFSRYPVKAGDCTKITHTSGSIIYIEEGAISSGLDSVIIHYRELHTPLDMIVHDIQMHTMLGDKIYLESTGMFEIYALAGGDTITIAPGKTIEVRMAITSRKVDPRVEGYIYDREQEHWQNFTNQINILKIDDDDNLWGSPPVSNASAVDNNLPAELEEGWGTGEPNAKLKKVLQTMSINQFGLYNFDKMLGGFNYTYVKADFIDNKSKPVQSTIYLVYKNINSVFYFPPSSWQSDFFIIQNQPYKLFTINKDGTVLQLSKYPTLSTIANKQYIFALENIGKPANRRDLSSKIGIQ